MEALVGVRHFTKKGNYMLSFDGQGGLYALGIAEQDRYYSTVDVRGQLYRPAGLPMGWSLSPFYFIKFTEIFVTYLRKPEPELPSSSTHATRSKRYLRRTGWRATRILPYVDDFLLFASSEEEALSLCKRLSSLFGSLVMQRDPTKGFWEPYCQFGGHLGVDHHRLTERFFLRQLHALVGEKWAAGSSDERRHLTLKELKAARLSVESSLSHLAGRNVLLHEDNPAVSHVLVGLTSRSRR
eukprot:jgi/Tetstr1/437223/TSEL_025953.t1